MHNIHIFQIEKLAALNFFERLSGSKKCIKDGICSFLSCDLKIEKSSIYPGHLTPLVTVDKSGSNKSALDSYNRDLGEGNEMEIRQVKYLNNIVEQDHRFIKKRTRPTLGFKNFDSASARITGIENIPMIKKGQIFGCDSSRSLFHNFCALIA